MGCGGIADFEIYGIVGDDIKNPPNVPNGVWLTLDERKTGLTDNYILISDTGHEPRKESKLKAASAHRLRHSYVTYLLESGAPLKVAQENAGHSNAGTTISSCCPNR